MTDQDYYQYLIQRGRLAAVYRRWYLYPRICRHLQGRVLDVGCGIGDFLRFRPDTVGVDTNPYLVEHCRKLGLNAHHSQGVTMPFETGEFQGVVMDNVLEHIAEPLPVLFEVSRVLTPGGKFVVGVPGLRGHAADPDHKIFYDERGLIDCLAGAGFTVRTSFHVPLKSRWCDHTVRQYCIYGVFTRTSAPEPEEG